MQSFRKITDPAFQWGALFKPERMKETRKEGLRTVIFGSTTAGNLVLHTLAKLEQVNPGRMNLAGMVTDDPLDPATQISVRKRIWSKYSGEESERLRDLVITSCMETGIPCFTGGIKTDAFRAMFIEWDPDLVIVCCFGQRIDDILFSWPSCGMYNFHPSDLAANIGAGPSPFELTLNHGRTTSRMIIHRVNAIIDGGPIVGISPPINICLPDGKYPASLLTLQEKIPSICGWMTIGLVDAIVDRNARGEPGPVTSVDFETLIPQEIRALLMEPVNNDLSSTYMLPEHFMLR